MDQLNRIILDNTILSYLIVAGVILLIFIFRRFLSSPLALVIYYLSKKRWSNLEKKQFIEMIARPMGWLITILIGIASISNLNYPILWNFKIYNTPFHSILNKLSLAIVIISISWFITKFVNFIAYTLKINAKLTDKMKDDQLVVFFRDLLKVFIVIGCALFILGFVFDRNLSNLLTGLSIIGAALALAAKETIENLIASFIIFFDEPFFTGEIVKVNNITGTIEHIGLRSTRIRTNDKTLVTVPNKQMVDSQVDNWSKRSERRAEIKLELSILTPSSKLEAFIADIKKILAAKEDILRYSVFFTEFNKGGKVLLIEYFTAAFSMDMFNQKKEEINISFSELIEKLSIEMAAGASVTIVSDGGFTPPKSPSII